MHRDQIRLFPGDVESQVRRLERFRAPANALLADEFNEEVDESGYASRFLDYYPRSERRRVWDIVRETAYNPGMVLLIGLLTLMSGGEAGIISILLISIFTGPMIWVAFRGLRHMRSMSSRRNLVLC